MDVLCIIEGKKIHSRMSKLADLKSQYIPHGKIIISRLSKLAYLNKQYIPH